MSKYKLLSVKVTPIDPEELLHEEYNRQTYEQQFELEDRFGICKQSSKDNPKLQDRKTLKKRSKRHRELHKAYVEEGCK